MNTKVNHLHKNGLLIILCSSLLINAQASTVTPAILNTANQNLVNVEMQKNQAANEADAEDCADVENPDSLGGIQAKEMNERKKIWLNSIDFNKVFEQGKANGCFAALSDFPDLSVNIPSLSSIFGSIKQTLLNYATRKVCNAVNDALEEVVGPLKDTLEDLSDRGQLDLTGRINTKAAKKLYEIDPELGRTSTPVTTDKKFEW